MKSPDTGGSHNNGIYRFGFQLAQAGIEISAQRTNDNVCSGGQ